MYVDELQVDWISLTWRLEVVASIYFPSIKIRKKKLVLVGFLWSATESPEGQQSIKEILEGHLQVEALLNQPFVKMAGNFSNLAGSVHTT